MSLHDDLQIAAIVHDVDIKIRAQNEIVRRTAHSRQLMRELYLDGMAAPEIERRSREGLLELGYSEAAIVGAGVGLPSIRKAAGSRG